MKALAASLLLIGLAFELVGVIMMARRYVRIVPLVEVPRLLLAALTRKPAARAAARLHPLWVEDSLDSLQGLAFIAVGFVCQTVVAVLGVFRTD
jgi:hypothetical protein